VKVDTRRLLDARGIRIDAIADFWRFGEGPLREVRYAFFSPGVDRFDNTQGCLRRCYAGVGLATETDIFQEILKL
jgi:hypothetical protein